MKKLLILAIFGITFVASAKTNALTGIKFSSYQGANVKGHCVRYATTVAFDLQKRGIESWYLEYDWKSGNSDGAHAICVFHTGETWYIVDNEWPYPSKVKHDEFEKMVRQRFPHVVKIRTVLTVGGEIGNLKDLLTTTK